MVRPLLMQEMFGSVRLILTGREENSKPAWKHLMSSPLVRGSGSVWISAFSLSVLMPRSLLKILPILKATGGHSHINRSPEPILISVSDTLSDPCPQFSEFY